MPLSEIMQAVEQETFASELNFAAGMKAFRRGLVEHQLFRNLADHAKTREARKTIAQRIEELSGSHIDTRYENRFDVALSAYLTALSESADPELLGEAAESAARAPNTWWALSISHELLTAAFARGWARAQAAPQIDVANTVPGVVKPEVTRAGLPEWLKSVATSPRDLGSRGSLPHHYDVRLLQRVPQISNVTICTEEGEESMSKVHGRRGKRIREAYRAVPMNPRGRQYVRV